MRMYSRWPAVRLEGSAETSGQLALAQQCLGMMMRRDRQTQQDCCWLHLTTGYTQLDAISKPGLSRTSYAVRTDFLV